MRNALTHGYFGVDFEIVMNTPNSATQYNVMLPPGTVLRLFRNFDEEQPIMPEKTHIPLSAADVKRPRPYKTSEINIRLSISATNEQYHQMCGRASLKLPVSTLESCQVKLRGLSGIIHTEGVRGCYEKITAG